jgi:ABC-type uncharacterized transport system involved in gliding motility auxiliary subunit
MNKFLHLNNQNAGHKPLKEHRTNFTCANRRLRLHNRELRMLYWLKIIIILCILYYEALYHYRRRRFYRQ